MNLIADAMGGIFQEEGEMSDRLQQIREAVVRDVANLEDAYADRAWLLHRLDEVGSYAEQLKAPASAALDALIAVRDGKHRLSPEVERAIFDLRKALAKNPGPSGTTTPVGADPSPAAQSTGPVGLGPLDKMGCNPASAIGSMSGTTAGVPNPLPQQREAIIKECWDTIDALIVSGHLPGNGCDKTAERNGLIFAANALAAKMGWPQAKYAESLPAIGTDKC